MSIYADSREKTIHPFFLDMPSTDSSDFDEWHKTLSHRLVSYPQSAYDWNRTQKRRDLFIRMAASDEFSSISCAECESIVGTIVNMRVANHSVEHIKRTFQTNCESSANSGSCRGIASFFSNEPYSLIKQLYSQNWTPQAFCAGFTNLCLADCCLSDEPEQVKVLFDEEFNEYVISWVQRSNTSQEVTVHQIDGNDKQTVEYLSKTTTYTSGGFMGYIHHINTKPVPCSTQIDYHVKGIKLGSFWTLPCDGHARYLHVGDMDTGSFTKLGITRALELHEITNFHGVIVSGDIGYSDGNEARNNDIGRIMEPLLRMIPGIIVAGNHDRYREFEIHKLRYPKRSNKTHNVQRTPSVDFININTESYLDAPYVSDEQLKEINKSIEVVKENQRQPVWKVLLTHRPQYATAHGVEHEQYPAYIRKRLQDINFNIALSGHIHGYQVAKTFISNDAECVNTTSTHMLSRCVRMFTIVGLATQSREDCNCSDPWCVTVSEKVGVGVISVTPTTFKYRYVDAITGHVDHEWV